MLDTFFLPAFLAFLLTRGNFPFRDIFTFFIYPGIALSQSKESREVPLGPDIYHCKTKSSLCPACETSHIENIVGYYGKGSYCLGCMYRYTGISRW